jgi:glycosyltransferase involved in cell wall biosynthesis
MIGKYSIYVGMCSGCNKRIFNLVNRNDILSLMQIILAVTNDVSTDQRVIRTASTLKKMQAEVTIIGRRIGKQQFKTDPLYHAIRMNLLFKRGPLFYAEYNFRLFFRLLFMKADLIVSNDLDTLPAAFLVSEIRKITLVYDSHEYFTEVPELLDRKRVQKFWGWLESVILPNIQHAYTVSGSIAMAYGHKYGIQMKVVRNLPFRINPTIQPTPMLRTGSEKIILYQGSLNLGRGLELAIHAIRYTVNTRLIIIGKGDVEKKLKQLVHALAMEDRVTFIGRVPPDQLPGYTIQADVGISLEEDLGLNYRFALPNKVFDYIQAGIPVLVSDLPEVRALVEEYGVGQVNSTQDPQILGALFTEMAGNEEKRSVWKTNLKIAGEELCWEKEEGILAEILMTTLISSSSKPDV